MRKLILHMGISIDGFVAAGDGAHDWGYAGEDEAAKRWKLDSLWNAGAHLMGRGEVHQPTVARPPRHPRSVGVFAPLARGDQQFDGLPDQRAVALQ